MAPGKENFYTDFVYHNREERARFVWLKYQRILQGKLLDVGADECHLKKWLGPGTSYTGIGIGGTPDMECDLESGPLPFPDRAYDVVLCLDVLEHLEGIHRIFDELCRVSRRYVIISLPNCLGHLWNILTQWGGEADDALMKYYGLPSETPPDRHRWFFDAIEAERFIRTRAQGNHMNVVQLDFAERRSKPTFKKRMLFKLSRWILLHRDIDQNRLLLGPAWAVLERQDG